MINVCRTIKCFIVQAIKSLNVYDFYVCKTMHFVNLFCCYSNIAELFSYNKASGIFLPLFSERTVPFPHYFFRDHNMFKLLLLVGVVSAFVDGMKRFTLKFMTSLVNTIT